MRTQTSPIVAHPIPRRVLYLQGQCRRVGAFVQARTISMSHHPSPACRRPQFTEPLPRIRGTLGAASTASAPKRPIVEHPGRGAEGDCLEATDGRCVLFLFRPPPRSPIAPVVSNRRRPRPMRALATWWRHGEERASRRFSTARGLAAVRGALQVTVIDLTGDGRGHVVLRREGIELTNGCHSKARRNSVNVIPAIRASEATRIPKPPG